MSATLSLAESLGKVRKRSLRRDGQRCARGSGHGDRRAIKYFVVIDFESTCWPRARPGCRDAAPPPEVIEFPAVLVRASDGQILDEFHSYVLPTEEPRLSSFCVSLTGIQQSRLEEEGAPLHSVLAAFNRWAEKVKAEHGISINETEVKEGKETATVLTWSDWDINVCLWGECRRKQLTLPAPLRCWGDLRLLYSQFYTRKPQGLAGALRDLGLSFEGREHSGLCDARNTARLAHRMAADGCGLGATKGVPGWKLPDNLKADMPNNCPKANRTVQTTFKKPALASGPPTVSSSATASATFCFGKTPPLCQCGKRSRLLTAQRPGPNQGRSFFSCRNSNRRGSDGAATGCKFFKWEDSVGGGGAESRRLTVRQENDAVPNKKHCPAKKELLVPEDSEDRGISWLHPQSVASEQQALTTSPSPNSLTSSKAPRTQLGLNRRSAILQSSTTVLPKPQYFGNVKLNRL